MTRQPAKPLGGPHLSADAVGILCRLRHHALRRPVTERDLAQMRRRELPRPDLVTHIGMNGRVVMINTAFHRAHGFYLAAWPADGEPLTIEEATWLCNRFFAARPVLDLSRAGMSAYLCRDYGRS